MHAVEVINVSKRFRDRGRWVEALKDVSLTIEKGAIFGLLGPNGAGKTTLINIIINLVTPDSGSVRILGKDNKKALEEINYVSGDTRFHWVLNVEDVLNFYATCYGLSKPESRKKIEGLVSFFGLEEVRKRRFTALSTGERMRLIFAKALLNRPSVLLLDEPTLGLDPSMAIAVRDEIKRVKNEFNTTVLLTSHYMAEVEMLCDRIAFINNGEIIDEGEIGKVKAARFSGYQVNMTVREIKGSEFLKKQGFEIKGKVIIKHLGTNEDLSSVISFLHRNGYEILDVAVLRPSLEDYFVKIVKENKG